MLVGNTATAYGGQFATHVTHGQGGAGGMRVLGGHLCNLGWNWTCLVLHHILWHHTVGIVHNKLIEANIPLKQSIIQYNHVYIHIASELLTITESYVSEVKRPLVDLGGSLTNELSHFPEGYTCTEAAKTGLLLGGFKGLP